MNVTAMRKALEKASLHLMSVDGCYATDLTPRQRAAALAKNKRAKIEWRVDESELLDQIDRALGRKLPADRRSTSGRRHRS